MGEWSKCTIPGGSDGDSGGADAGDRDGGVGDGGDGDSGDGGDASGGDGGDGTNIKNGGDESIYSIRNMLHSVNGYYIWRYMVTLPKPLHNGTNVQFGNHYLG